ncbi:hypothetical protein SAMN06265348_11087 [Pedobacter westerhofensis]|uniref:Outer membrane protein n=1 Tax=Pedobacter westerhofensis TaxID=425512 RepID=A0A521F3I1_9SPHI|nr:hypothetical protein [Pedobacter westerhofensis]SMO90713.1 hypothetical protein SAMN06265348_11087 [Pedobacter westerhofensis]
MKRALLILIFILAGYQFGRAQFNSSAIENRIRPDSNAVGEVHFNFYNFNYVRDYEYSNQFHDGYTLYGTQLQPQLVYYAHPNLAIIAGAYIRKDFGDNGVHDSKPLFALKYHKKDLSLIFGSLEGGIHHGYIEQLWDFERQITDPIQYGTQLIIEKEKWKLDAWIAWQKQIYTPSPVKEQIVGGLTAERSLWQSNGWKLSLPFQFLVYHKGGQIDTLKSVPLLTMGNGATGLKLHKEIGGNVQEIFTDNYIVGYKDFSPTKIQAFQGGYGLWFNAGANTRWGSLVASYWKGNNFQTIKGMPLYESVSSTLYDAGHKESNRSILLLRYAYQHELLPNLYLDVRVEPHVDLGTSRTEQLQFQGSFFLTYKQDFKLFKIKQ